MDATMFVGQMPNGQPCVRLPRGLVATMEAGSDAVRASDAAEVAQRYNAYPDLLAALSALVTEADAGGGSIRSVSRYSVDKARAAIARATGGGA